MFAVIYRSYIKSLFEEDYQRHWKVVASYFVKERGALASALHKTEEGMWVAYSRWPNKAMRDAAWPSDKESINPELPLPIQEAIKGLKQCIDQEQLLPEICMEVVEEVRSRQDS